MQVHDQTDVGGRGVGGKKGGKKIPFEIQETGVKKRHSCGLNSPICHHPLDTCCTNA